MKKNWPIYSNLEIKNVGKILSSGKVNFWTGSECKNFEKEFSNYFKIKYSTCVANGSLALECALKAIGVKKNDTVIVPSKSYFSSASCVVNVGATPIFSEVDLNTQNITKEFAEQVFKKNTKAIICVHLSGIPCEMDKIVEFAKKKNIKIIEDCSQAHGAKFKNKFVGSFGDIAIWSFCNDKIISTGGEGGMIATNNKKIWKKIWYLKEIGKDYDALTQKKHKPGFKWVHNHFGTNLRMTEMQASVGRSQLKKLKQFLTLRRHNYETLRNFFKKFSSIIVPTIKYDCEVAPYRCYVYTNPKILKKNTNIHLCNLFNMKKIDCNVGSCSEIYREKSFQKIKIGPNKRFDNAKFLSHNSIAFRVDQTIDKKEIKKIIMKIKKIFANNNIV